MPVINTNVSALSAQAALTKNSRTMSTAMEQLSTGSRINSAKDDAAGMAIGTSMTSQIRGLNQAVRNLNDGVNLLQTAEGALNETTNMLQRMRELAVQSASGTYSTTQRSYLAVEFNALGSQIDKVASETTWNGYTVLTGTTGGTTAGTFSFQSGQTSGQTIDVAIASMALSGMAMTAAAVGVSCCCRSNPPLLVQMHLERQGCRPCRQSPHHVSISVASFVILLLQE
jgi:flagellin